MGWLFGGSVDCSMGQLVVWSVVRLMFDGLVGWLLDRPKRQSRRFGEEKFCPYQDSNPEPMDRWNSRYIDHAARAHKISP